MTIQIRQPKVYTYNEINIGKFKSTKHFELTEHQQGQPCKLSNLINISKDRKFAMSSPDYWLQIRKDNKWQSPRLTGLFKTKFANVYKGDVDKKKHLLLFKFSNNGNTLTIYYFENYYTDVLSNVTHFIR